MVQVLVSHKVEDYSRWKSVFDDALMMRRNAGELNFRIFRNFENSNEVTLLCDFDSVDHAKRFIASEELKKAMMSAGVTSIPVVKMVYEALAMRRGEAD